MVLRGMMQPHIPHWVVVLEKWSHSRQMSIRSLRIARETLGMDGRNRSVKATSFSLGVFSGSLVMSPILVACPFFGGNQMCLSLFRMVFSGLNQVLDLSLPPP